jgi:hypothetical protein
MCKNFRRFGKHGASRFRSWNVRYYLQADKAPYPSRHQHYIHRPYNLKSRYFPVVDFKKSGYEQNEDLEVILKVSAWKAHIPRVKKNWDADKW